MDVGESRCGCERVEVRVRLGELWWDKRVRWLAAGGGVFWRGFVRNCGGRMACGCEYRDESTDIGLD